MRYESHTPEGRTHAVRAGVSRRTRRPDDAAYMQEQPWRNSAVCRRSPPREIPLQNEAIHARRAGLFPGPARPA